MRFGVSLTYVRVECVSALSFDEIQSNCMADQKVTNDRQVQLPPLRSLNSVDPSYVRFFNQSSRNVDVYWLNYSGAQTLYSTLTPEGYLDVNTFVSHPWIFRDNKTRQFLVVRNRPIFYPPPVDPERPTRRTIRITIPVYPLREMCLHYISSKVSKEELSKLGIPQILVADLQRLKQ